jgi:hypothetical protein
LVSNSKPQSSKQCVLTVASEKPQSKVITKASKLNWLMPRKARVTKVVTMMRTTLIRETSFDPWESMIYPMKKLPKTSPIPKTSMASIDFYNLRSLSSVETLLMASVSMGVSAPE